MTTIPGYTYDHGQWVPLSEDDLTFDYSEPTVAWNITWVRNPWFSLGIHIDHKWPQVVLFLPGIELYIGRQPHWSDTRGLRRVR